MLSSFQVIKSTTWPSVWPKCFKVYTQGSLRPDKMQIPESHCLGSANMKESHKSEFQQISLLTLETQQESNNWDKI